MSSRFASRTRPLRGALLLLLVLLLAGCAREVDKSDFAGPDWSRGLVLGTATINNRPALTWDSSTESTLIIWVGGEAGQMLMRFARIDRQGGTVSSHPLEIPVRQPSQPKLWCDSAGGIHLFWLDSETDREPTLYHVRIDLQGNPLSPPQKVAPADAAVAGYTIAQAIPEALDIFWSDDTRASAALYHARMSLTENDSVRIDLLGVGGAMPAAISDAQQRIHMVWYGSSPDQGEGVVYARYDPLASTLSDPMRIARVSAGTNYPPEIGLDWERAYVFWSQERRGGGGGTASAETWCRSVGLDDLKSVEACRLAMPATDRPKYAPAEGDLNYHSLAPVDDAEPRAWSSYTYMPYPLPGQRQELAMVLSTRMLSRQGKGELQIVLAILRGGQVEGYQTAGQTNSASLRPIALADAHGQVHLSWLDTAGFGEYRIYYASTEPQIKAVVNRLTARDILRALAGRAWNTAAAFSFLPMLLVWLLPPLLWLVIAYLIYPDRTMNTRSGRLWLGGAVILYLAAKAMIVPSFLWYAPFLELVPARFQDLLIFGIPGIIALGSFVLMRWLLRGADRQEILYGFVVFAAIDAGLSLVLYIPNAIA